MPPRKKDKHGNEILTDKERIFCSKYVIYHNATRAAIEAGYSEKTANIVGPENLSKPCLKKEIDRLSQNFIQHMAELGITKQRTAQEIATLAYCNFIELQKSWIERHEWETLKRERPEILKCIQEIDTKIEYKAIEESDGKKRGQRKVEYVKVKLFDKAKAIEILNKMMGWNEAEKLNVINEPDFSKMTYEQLYQLKYGRKPD